MVTITKHISLRWVAFYALCALWVSLTFSKALVEISFGIALVAWLGYKARQRRWVPLRIPASLFIPLLGFVLISCLSILWSEYPDRSFRGIFKVLQQVMIFLMLIDVTP